MKKIIHILLLLVITNLTVWAQTDENISALNKLIELRDSLRTIHPALEKLYPVAVYSDSIFKIYEFSSADKTYRLHKTTPSLRHVINGIRAAFPLEENDYKMTCVVTSDAFDDLKDYTIIFHEFVHCYQAETMEYELKDSIEVYRNSMEKKNYMWELNYPFPYDSMEIQELYSNFIDQLVNGNLQGAEKIHDNIKEKLSSFAFQFMSWVEWKEGSARWIENMIREKLKIDENIAGKKNELSRVSFYYGGSNYIKLLSENYKTNNLKDLFVLIFNN